MTIDEQMNKYYEKLYAIRNMCNLGSGIIDILKYETVDDLLKDINPSNEVLIQF